MSTMYLTPITPEVIKDHGITPEEYERIKASLGREPSLTELGIFSVMWSEHCSYKSSRVHLKRLPTRSKLVVQGPGENAGIIDIGDGWACAFKIESHNHPSFIEPFQGAATGVGGILRDIFTMGARPFAVMDSLRFGPIVPAPIAPSANEPTLNAKDAQKMEHPADQATIHRNHSVLEGVVSGIASYGNCFGVPNLGGETKFEPCYSGNPLVNAFALGLVRRDQIFYAKAAGEGNPVIYVGAKTGRDGIHGATMASEEFSEGSEQKRPNVQVGDPFLEKLLLEACVEAMHTGAVVGIQDMGAAGLTCSTCEMGARGGVGIEIELDLVPQRETGMNAYEIMLSESQERMLLVAESGREQEVLKVFDKWGLDGVIVGRVTSGGRLRVLEHGQLVADIPNTALTDDAPLYHRPMEPWSAPVSRTKPDTVRWSNASDFTENLKRLLAAPNICSKRWIFEQYDSMVQSNTVEGPGADAGLMRIKGSKRALAMALDGNGRWCWLDPKLGAMHAVAESARNVSCTGATPVAATNCLNFGNPEKPQIMWQFSQVVDGLTEACTTLETPITGGNVSLYNETLGEGIYPTPVIGIVGTLENVEDAMTFHFRQPDLDVFLLSGTAENGNAESEFGSTEYAKEILGQIWGVPPALDLKQEAALQNCLRELIKDHAIESAHDCSDGGLAVALAEASFVKPKPRLAIPYIGAEVDLNSNHIFTEGVLFGEAASRVVISCDRKKAEIIQQRAVRWGVRADRIGRTIPEKLVISIDGKQAVSAKVSDLRQVWDTMLVRALHVGAPEHLVPEVLQKS
ncbi:MAG TPA: phosphoribosylformylglycinamidine synthase subunit PurL [Candidatus Acidoferrales bacterium]|nr:phosphoribosylformylglycinamidine synthase subunit PurL [Candidatus Acidoferrales bacterium]